MSFKPAPTKMKDTKAPSLIEIIERVVALVETGKTDSIEILHELKSMIPDEILPKEDGDILVYYHSKTFLPYLEFPVRLDLGSIVKQR